MTNSYYILYERFFTGLGFRVVKGDEADPEGMEEAGSGVLTGACRLSGRRCGGDVLRQLHAR